jgi:hypothetical protein
MAVVTKRLGKGTIGTAASTLYTVPAGAKALVKALTIGNTSNNPSAFTLALAGTQIISAHIIKGNDTITIPFLDQVLESGESITASSTTGTVTYYISGKEVT